MQIKLYLIGISRFISYHPHQIKHYFQHERDDIYQAYMGITHDERRRRVPYQPGATPQEMRITEHKGL